jgi:putative ABC transport system substrate-binding protein
MDRRAFIGTLTGGLLAAPLAAGAQQAGKVYRIGFLGVLSAPDYAANLNAFLQGLRDLGYDEGRNIVIEYRWAEGREEHLPTLAAQLVRLNPDVLVTHATGVRAAQQATSTVPIVMGASADPVGMGLVKSLARPGGNTTGVASQIVDLASKRLELLREAVPHLRQVAVLWTGSGASREAVRETQVTAGKLGVRVRSFEVGRGPTDLETVFTAILRERPDGLIVFPNPLLNIEATNARIVEFAARNRLPTMGGQRRFVANGGLMSYAGDFTEGWRLAARYVDRILKGAKPGDLPIEQPRTYALAINLKTAQTLGLTIPPSLLQRADQVIE